MEDVTWLGVFWNDVPSMACAWDMSGRKRVSVHPQAVQAMAKGMKTGVDMTQKSNLGGVAQRARPESVKTTMAISGLGS